MTEEQRRALFALREALRLCEGAGLALRVDRHRQIEIIKTPSYWDRGLRPEDVNELLEEHPE